MPSDGSAQFACGIQGMGPGSSPGIGPGNGGGTGTVPVSRAFVAESPIVLPFTNEA